MNTHEVLRKIKEELRKEAEIIAHANGEGNARDWAHYKEMAGKAKGLTAAIKIIDSIFKKTLSEDME